MSWFSKKLKKFTNVVDPIGKALRKSTGGSYGDPMNWYNSKPNQTTPWQPTPSRGLMQAPNGQQTLGTTNLGGVGMAPRDYTQNPFINGPGARQVPGLTAPTGGKGGTGMPAGPMKNPSMSFGGPQMAQQQPPQQQMDPAMQNQMIQAQRLRGMRII